LFGLSGLSFDGKNLDRSGVLGGVLNGSSSESSNSSIDSGCPRIVAAAATAAAATIFGSLFWSNVLYLVNGTRFFIILVSSKRNFGARRFGISSLLSNKGFSSSRTESATGTWEAEPIRVSISKLYDG